MHAQTTFLGQGSDTIINSYSAVDIVHCWDENNVDSVTLAAPPGYPLAEGDTVMLFYVKGALREDDPGEDDPGSEDPSQTSTGKYAILLVNEVNGNIVVFNNSVRKFKNQNNMLPLAPGEMAQLIKVRSFRNAVVSGNGLTAKAWNKDEGSGGVLAMFVHGTLKLEADIDVSGKGFKGASEELIALLECSAVNPSLYDSIIYQESSNELAGLKGEGTTNALNMFTRGKARNINGGGGGNGKFSGGGGGSNYSDGGIGGPESFDCPATAIDPNGVGGWPMGDRYYSNVVGFQNRYDRITFGGGGGTGTRASGRISTSGGNGGGIVVIVADTIEGNGINYIRADGNDVTEVATGAGGGGGGGGGIILDVNEFKNNVMLSAVGGDGGNTNHPSDVTGPGGGGGGGAYWLSGNDKPGVETMEDLGDAGRYLPNPGDLLATSGFAPGRIDGLEAPLRGFIFNPVPTEFWVCSDQVPDPILVAEPKGGTGSYTYQWIDSTESQSWTPIPGATEKDLSFSTPLSDTVYFRRIVRDDVGPLIDTSFRISMYVHQAIEDNVVRANDGLSPSDEVCQNLAPLPFKSVGLPTQGIGTYQYQWIVHEGDGQFDPAPGQSDQVEYNAPPLGNPVDHFFARVVNSGACADTSANIITTVHPLLEGNVISRSDSVCWNTAPELLSGPEPTGGKAGDYNYTWEDSTATSGTWEEIPGAIVIDYQPSEQEERIWFRRVARSGTGMRGDACIDYSPQVEIFVVDTIENNAILSPDEIVCTDDQPAMLEASQPGGGFENQYAFQWEWKTESGDWELASEGGGSNNEQGYQPPVMAANGESRFFRRVVGSGGPQNDVCTKISNEVFVEVLPRITNNLIATATEVICQGGNLEALNGQVPGGGAEEGGNDPTRNYKWERANFTGTDMPASGWTQVAYGPDSVNYRAGDELSSEEDYWYRRIVFSGPVVSGQEQVCADTTSGAPGEADAPVHITIHTSISDFAIDDSDSACHLSTKELQGLSAKGEPDSIPSYQWRVVGGNDLPGKGQNYSHEFQDLGPLQFERLVGIGVCVEVSNSMDITVMELPGATLSTDLDELCETDTLFDVAFNNGDLSYYIPTNEWEVFLMDDVTMVESGPYKDSLNEGGIRVDLETHSDDPSTRYTYSIHRIQYTTLDGEVCAVDDGSDLIDGEAAVHVFNKPKPVIKIEGDEASIDSICGFAIDLEVDPDNGSLSWSSDHDQYVSYTQGPGDNISVALDESKEAYAVERYWLTFRSDAGDCFDTSSIELFFYEEPDPAFAGKDTTAFLSNSIQMNADPATAGQGTWTLEGGNGNIQDPNDPNTLITGLDKEGENEFRWTVTNGVCSSSQDVTIVTYREVWRPEGISINEDGLNDYFIVKGLAEADEFSLTVFNNLGKTVRKVNKDNVDEVIYDENLISNGLAEDELVVWDGRASNGNFVPAGTYYYVISMTIQQKDGSVDAYEYKDWIVVRR